MSSHDSTLEEIKDRIDIVDLISEYVHLKKAGQNWKGLCPFHTEKTPSFTVSPAKQIYHCFGCGNGGDIFTFVVRYENLSFPEALRVLAKKAGVEIKMSGKESAYTGEKEVMLNMHKDALAFYLQCLQKNSKGKGYLKSRGLDSSVLGSFSVGYALNSWNALLNTLVRKGYKPEMIRKAGLAVQGSKGVYDTFRDRIMFPIYDLKSDVIAFGGRAIDGGEPKYLNSPETIIFNKRRVLYGLDRAKESVKKEGSALFMEGYLDVITAHTFGFTNAVAPLGTAITVEHGKLIKRFAENVILVFDSDTAGIKAARNAAAILLESGLNVKMLLFPENADPDSFLRSKGKEAFQSILKSPLSIVDFIMHQKGEKRLLARDALDVISKVPDKILQGVYIKKLAEKLNVNERDVREEFQRLSSSVKSSFKKPAPMAHPRPATRYLDEEYIIRILLQMPEKVAEVCESVNEDDFRGAITKALLKRITEGPETFDDLLGSCSNEEKSFLTEMSMEDEFDDPGKVLADCIKRLKDKRKKSLLRDLQNKIKEAEKRKDLNLLKKLQAEQQHLLMNRM